MNTEIENKAELNTERKSEIARTEPETAPKTFKTFEVYLPAGLRATAISSDALRENQRISPVDNSWPVVEIFDLLNSEGDLRHVTQVRIEDPETHIEREVFRHVEILGPCRVMHDPHNPLRVHVDTNEQTSRNGVTDDHVPNTVQADRSGNVKKRVFGC